MKRRLTTEGLCLDEYISNDAYADVQYKRAIGESPEMECAKAIAGIIAQRLEPGDNILDVGCNAGHYLRSLKRSISASFSYLGIDYYSIFLRKAQEVWKDEPIANFSQGSIYDLPLPERAFSYVICSNVITHMPSIVGPISELIRVGRKLVIIRTPISDRSYRIQMVYSNKWWPYTDVRPEDEFDERGQPRAFSYFDIHSRDYFTSVIHRLAPHAEITYVEDDQFDPANIERSALSEDRIAATRVINGKQVSGCIILPHMFVIIDLGK